MIRGISLLLVFLLFSCMGEVPSSPVKEWEGMEFRLETRPPYITRGMMEFLVIANRPGRKPASDLLIELRVGPTGRWVQAIEDGNVGVYRRAMRINDPATDVMYMHIQNKKNKEGLLEFPLSYGIEK
jgi:hypothetical protein